jgi:two-component system, LuxR family, sensor kinase FixL
MRPPAPSATLKERLRRAEKAFLASEAKLKLAYEEIETRVQEKAAELIKSNKALQVEIAERKRAEKETLEIAQKEQRRFGSHLHDGLCQELTAILVFAKGLTQKIEKNKSLEIAELNTISRMILEATDQAREAARGLYPGELEGTSLMNSFEELASRTQSLPRIVCRFHCPKPILIDDNNVATHLYRIAQEGVSNAIKHGKAQSIIVSLTEEKGHISLVIKDNGIGFRPGVLESKGIGLHIMKYRAHMMDAAFYIEANRPHGVILKCILKSLP